MLKKAIKIVVAVIIILIFIAFILPIFAPVKSTPRSHYVRSDFKQLSIAITIYHSDGGVIPKDVGPLHDFAKTEKYLPLGQLRALTFKDNLIYDIYGSEIIYSYDADSKTCSFKSFGRNKVDDNGEKDDIIYEWLIGEF